MRRAIAALVAAFALLAPASALAAPPVISGTTFSGVTDSSAKLSASVDPSKGATEASFQYTTLEAFDAEEFQNAQSAPAGGISLPAEVKGSGDLKAGSELITAVATTAGTFAPGQTIKGNGIPAATTITAIEASGETLTLTISHKATETAPGVELKATGPQPIGATLEGLSPATGYVFRVVARKTGNKEEAQGPATTFYTLASPPVFDPCPNDAFRSGQYAHPGHPGALLPDCRSYELASPLLKNGNEVRSYPGFARAGTDGTVTFGFTFGIPGTQGAQNFPFYLATRGPGASGWSSSGLNPPGPLGDQTRYMIGQLPDLSASYAIATKLETNTARTALFELHADGSAPTQITPYVEVPKGSPTTIESFGFAGTSADENTVLIESRVPLPEAEGGEAIEGSAEGPNVYAWDRTSGRLHLASTMNVETETETLLAKGAFAGPYNWFSKRPAEGGAIGRYYLSEEHAVSADGSVYFTAATSGKLYQRLHPTQPQSALDGEGNCTEAAKACTIAVSTSRRHPLDPAGAEPAAFQTATADGSQVLFTSHEELTDDANTGPEQPKAAIGRATLHGAEPADEVNEEFIPTTHALGLAVDPSGEYLYWADPSKGTIGRAKLDGEGNVVPGSEDPSFIEPGEGQCPQEVPAKPGEEPTGIFEDTVIPDHPRYVTVEEGYVYWTNTGLYDSEGRPVDGGGTIGRAKLNGESVEEVEPAFICGVDASQPGKRQVSNPQGIAVNSEHIYWANAAGGGSFRMIARAVIGGGEVNAEFANPKASRFPYGLALDSTYLYLANDEPQNHNGYVSRVPLVGGEVEGHFIGEPGLRGVALDSEHLYWTTQGEGEEIGRSDLELKNIEKNFIDITGAPNGIAAGTDHLFWSTNGESSGNPGNDLYRYEPAGEGTLKDLTALVGGNGAEVQGVLGTSADGSFVYFAANADLDGKEEAQPGDCKGKFLKGAAGQCSIYLLHEGQVDFVARVDVSGEERGSDAVDWLSQARPFGSSAEKSSLVSPDGSTLVFKSKLKLTDYDNQSKGELYRYSLGEGLICLTCIPSGQPPSREPSFGSRGFPYVLNPGESFGAYRLNFASEDGNRLFFETPDALVGEDTDALGGCPEVPTDAGVLDAAPSCLDVYEWEALGTGSCSGGGPGYSPLDHGCIYLLSPDTEGPAFFLDASPSGNDVYIITPSQLVGEDNDELRDVYDARVEGGLAAQNQPPPAPPCEGEGCQPATSPPPPFQAPPQFSGPRNPKPKRCHAKRCHRHKKHKHHKRHRQAKHRVGARR